MRKTRGTNAFEDVIAALWIGVLILIFAVEVSAQKASFGAESVALNTIEIKTTQGSVTAANSGRDELMVKYGGKVVEIYLRGLEKTGKSAGAQLGSLIVMAYDAGGHYEYKKAYRIFLNECQECKAHSDKFNREYFDNAWHVRKMLLKIMPATLVDELGQRIVNSLM